MITELVRRTAVEELAKNFKDDPDTKTSLKERATQDDNKYVQREAAKELEKEIQRRPRNKNDKKRKQLTKRLTGRR
ncbi:HEAT repeat domain-containing protein, partial [Nostoc sp. CALU 546]|uniref:HEAT repeat domain-containing protein n=1 Tax=Nostoc sp. CALU 546 TaxID=1867241 RepID=UPI003B672B3F